MALASYSKFKPATVQIGNVLCSPPNKWPTNTLWTFAQNVGQNENYIIP